MTPPPHNGPPSRDTVSALDHLRVLMDERDARYLQWQKDKDIRDEQRFNQQNEFLREMRSATKEAVEKADAANKMHLQTLNEWRGTLEDQNKTFVTREAFDAAIAGLSRDIQALTAVRERAEGRGAGLNAGWTYLLGAAALGAALATIGAMILR